MADERDEIRARVNIVDLVGQRVQLKKAGKDLKGLCPFHDDKNPSFTVSPTSGRYRCWSCGESGDVFTWVMKTQNVEFGEALQQLAKQAGITLSGRQKTDQSGRNRLLEAMDVALSLFRESFFKSKEAQAYCANRGLTTEILSEWEIGFAPSSGEDLARALQKRKFSLAECRELFLVEQDADGGYYDRFRSRLMFPIRDERGELVAFGGRIIGEGNPKYINSSDTPLYRKSRLLYAMNRAKDHIAKSRRAVLVEGYLDVIACHAAGVKQAVASLGTAMSEDHAKLLARWCDEVVILYDADAAGEKAATRASEMLEHEGLRVKVALMADGQDPDTLLRTAGPAAVQKAVEGGLSPLDFQLATLDKKLGPDNPEYWDEAVAILAGATSELEIAKHLVRLAGLYPDIRDVSLAQRALRGQIGRARRQIKQGRRPESLPAVAAVRNLPGLDSSEKLLFGLLLKPSWRDKSWNVLKKKELLQTQRASQAVDALANIFDGDEKLALPSVWLGKLEQEVANLVASCELEDDYPNLEVQFRDAVSRLEHKAERRALADLKSTQDSDEKLREINDRLRRLSAKDA